jgi:hypothetical protein
MWQWGLVCIYCRDWGNAVFYIGINAITNLKYGGRKMNLYL